MKKRLQQILDQIPEITLQKTAGTGLANARDNLPHIRHSIADLSGRTSHEVAMVMSAGPSLHQRNPIAQIRQHGFSGPLVVVDSALGYCLRNGVVPEYVVTVDSHPTRIVRWFGDSSLEQREQDEYFERQEMEPAMHRNGLSWNRQLIELVNQYGPRIKAIISTSSPASVRERCQESGMELFWWNPMYDDYDIPDGWTRRIHELTKIPCMITGGNVGTSAWVFAASVLNARHVVLTGMDLGYPADNPITNTQYYPELVEIFGEHIEEAFIRIYNPHLKKHFYTDPTYYWYRQGFLELVQRSPCSTYNCTEGGILFGAGVKCMKLERFLKQAKQGMLPG